MQKTEHEKLNFFKPQEIINKVNNQSYKKIITLTLVLGLVIGLSNAFLKNALSVHENRVQVENQQSSALEQEEFNTLVKMVKKVDGNQFNHLISYMNATSANYDDQVNLLKKANSLAENEDYQGTLTASEKNQKLNDLVSNYKDFVEQRESSFNLMYNYLNSTDKPMLGSMANMDMMKKFLTWNQSANSGVFMNDNDLDNGINAILTTSKKGNEKYNIKNGIYEKMQALKDAQVSKMKSFAVTN